MLCCSVPRPRGAARLAGRAGFIALAAVAAAGCTGGAAGGADPIAAAKPDAPTAPPASSATPDLVPLPDGLEVTVDWRATGDEATDAAVAAAVNATRAQWAVMAAGDLDAVPYKNYVTGAAERSMFDEFVALYIADGIGLTGTDRLHDFQVSEVTATSATVAFCDDQSQLPITNRATGEIIPTPDVPEEWRVVNVVALVDSRWKVIGMSAEGGVAACDLDR